MGVFGLQSYVERKCGPDAFYPVDIKMLADIHRRNYSTQNNKEKVTMIIDLQGCVRKMYDGLDLISGGQFKNTQIDGNFF